MIVKKEQGGSSAEGRMPFLHVLWQFHLEPGENRKGV